MIDLFSSPLVWGLVVVCVSHIAVGYITRDDVLCVAEHEIIEGVRAKQFELRSQVSKQVTCAEKRHKFFYLYGWLNIHALQSRKNFGRARSIGNLASEISDRVIGEWNRVTKSDKGLRPA